MYVFMYLFLQNQHQGLCADLWSKTYGRHWISISFFSSSDSIVVFCCLNKILHELGVICKMSLFTFAFVCFCSDKTQKRYFICRRQLLTHLLNICTNMQGSHLCMDLF